MSTCFVQPRLGRTRQVSTTMTIPNKVRLDRFNTPLLSVELSEVLNADPIVLIMGVAVSNLSRTLSNLLCSRALISLTFWDTISRVSCVSDSLAFGGLPFFWGWAGTEDRTGGLLSSEKGGGRYKSDWKHKIKFWTTC